MTKEAQYLMECVLKDNRITQAQKDALYPLSK